MMLVGGEGEVVEFLLVSESSHPRPLTNRAKGKNSKKFPSQFFKGSKILENGQNQLKSGFRTP